MPANKERILLVESDPEISDLIARQVLKPMGYQVRVIGAAATAIQDAVRLSPDVILLSLNLPGLSGKDLLVALASQGIDTPIIVIAEQGMEGDVIQAFRLGASDYLHWPVREAEVLSAVERALKQVRARREREQLARQLEKTNQELQRRVRELTTIFSIGKAVISVTDQRLLFEKIVEGAVYVAEAERGWLLLRQDSSKTFLLSACQNMPKSVSVRVGEPWDDGISSLVALSGETLAIHGTPLKRFKVAQLGRAALVAPVKVQKEVVGLLVVMRAAEQAFSPSNQTLVEALCDYASISLVNARLFEALEQRAQSLQQAVERSKQGERVKAQILRNVSQRVRKPIDKAAEMLHTKFSPESNNLPADQAQALKTVQEQLDELRQIGEALSALEKASSAQEMTTFNLVDLARQALKRFLPQANQAAITLQNDLPKTPHLVSADIHQISQVLDALLSNALSFCSANGTVSLHLAQHPDATVVVAIQDTGPGIPAKQQEHIFDPFYQMPDENAPAVGLGIGLALAKEIVRAHGGKMWLKSQPGQGSTFYFSLRAPQSETNHQT